MNRSATAIPISGVVICRNEAHNIERCIESLKQLTDDIVVVDSGSTDDTVARAKALGARVFSREWTGYSDQKNFGNAQAVHDFILSIDADECVSPELANNIRLEMNSPQASVYEFEFITSWQGQFIYHGSWYPDRHCRLFDRNKIRWGSKGVHEELLMEGYSPRRLKGYIYHYTAMDREHYRQKMERYAMEFAANRTGGQRYSPVWKKYTSTAFRFLKDYVLKRGFLEGKAGWEIAVEEARYTYRKYLLSEKP